MKGTAASRNKELERQKDVRNQSKGYFYITYNGWQIVSQNSVTRKERKERNYNYWDNDTLQNILQKLEPKMPHLLKKNDCFHIWALKL